MDDDDIEDSDDDYVIEVSSSFPPDVTEFEGEYPVAGVSFRQEALTRFIEGANRRLRLVPEPTNDHDPNAIRVEAIWREPDGGSLVGLIGYLPREHSAVLANRDPNLLLHARPVALFRATESRDAGIRMVLGWSIDKAGVRRQAARRARRRGRAAAPKGCASVLLAAIAVATLAGAASLALALSGCATVPQMRAELASSFAKFRAEETGVLTSGERDWIALLGISIAVASAAAGLLRWATARRRRQSRDAFEA